MQNGENEQLSLILRQCFFFFLQFNFLLQTVSDIISAYCVMLKTLRKVTKISIKGAKLVNFHLSTIKNRIEIFI